MFENTIAFNGLNYVQDFSTIDGDVLDISDLLSGYNAVTDTITDFVQITDSGANSLFYVDTAGTGTFGAGALIAQINGVTGLTDEAALELAGHLVA